MSSIAAAKILGQCQLMMTLSQFTLRNLICSVVLTLLPSCSSQFEAFWDRSEGAVVAASPGQTATEMQFLGVSSFLVRDGKTRIMIDGFMSRPKAALIAPIAPRADVVMRGLERLGLSTRPACGGPTRDGARLDAVFAVHGHYDHALDAPLIAGVTGAGLIADSVVMEVAGRTADLYSDICPASIEGRINIPETGGFQTYPFGSVTLRLIRTPHSDNPASTLLEYLPKNPDWAFPTSAKNLKEGDGVAVHITTRAGRILIVPTAGHVDEIFEATDLRADVLFLGIGGVGWSSRDEAMEYFRGTIQASGAHVVVPIHWDRHSPPLEGGEDSLPIPLYENLDRVLRFLDEFSQEYPDFELVSVPVFAPFDPFATRPPERVN